MKNKVRKLTAKEIRESVALLRKYEVKPTNYYKLDFKFPFIHREQFVDIHDYFAAKAGEAIDYQIRKALKK